MKKYAEKNVNFSAIRVTEYTEMMYKEMNKAYLNASQKAMNIADLGRSTKNFNLFVTSTISKSVTSS